MAATRIAAPYIPVSEYGVQQRGQAFRLGSHTVTIATMRHLVNVYVSRDPEGRNPSFYTGLDEEILSFHVSNVGGVGVKSNLGQEYGVLQRVALGDNHVFPTGTLWRVLAASRKRFDNLLEDGSNPLVWAAREDFDAVLAMLSAGESGTTTIMNVSAWDLPREGALRAVYRKRE